MQNPPTTISSLENQFVGLPIFFDIETNTKDIADPKAKISIWGWKIGSGLESGELHCIEGIGNRGKSMFEESIEPFHGNATIITFNGNNFDIPLAERFGVDFTGFHHLDLAPICKDKINGNRYNISKSDALKKLGVSSSWHSLSNLMCGVLEEKQLWRPEERSLLFEHNASDLCETERLFILFQRLGWISELTP